MSRVPINTDNNPAGHFRAIKDIKQALLGRLTFGENIQSTVTEVTFVTANADQTINHGLERIPVSFIAHADVATNIYKGTVAWTDKTITLKSSVAPAVVTLTIV